MNAKRQEIIVWIPWKAEDTVESQRKIILVLYNEGHVGIFHNKVRNSGNCSMYAIVSIPKA